MQRSRTIRAALLGIVGLLSVSTRSGAAPPVPSQSPTMAAECAIRAEPAGGLLRLQAVARSDQALAGRYSLSVLKRNAGGTSSNVQSGSFSLEPGHEALLTTLMLEGSAAGHYSAKLSLHWDDGSVSCTSP